MHTKVQKWGNSLALRIPKFLAVEVGLTSDDAVDLMLEDGKLIVTPLNGSTFTLDGLLADITDENIHAEVETGPPVGGEVW